MTDEGHSGVDVGRTSGVWDALEHASEYIHSVAGYTEWEWEEASWRYRDTIV